MDRSLFSGSADRMIELEKWSGIPGPALVDIAVTHQMGHGIARIRMSAEPTTTARSCAMAGFQIAQQNAWEEA
jgi:hypothetical protein